MILRAFVDFLTSDAVLASELRQSGRERLRELIAEIYHGNRPRGAGPVCLGLQRSSGIVHAMLNGPLDLETPIVDLHIYAKDTDDMGGSEAVEEVLYALKDLLPQYQGEFGDQTVQLISQEGEGRELDVHPVDALDNWTYHYTISYMIGATRVVPIGVN